MNYNRDLSRIEHIIREAKLAAWGQRMTPVETRRKVRAFRHIDIDFRDPACLRHHILIAFTFLQVRVGLGGPPRLDEDGNVVLGKSLEMVVDPSGEVYIVRPVPPRSLRIADTYTAAPLPTFRLIATDTSF